MLYFSYGQITLGPITVYTWGLFLGLAFLTCFALISNQAQKQRSEREKIAWLGFFIFLAALVGSRLGYIFQFPFYYFYHFSEIFKLWDGGLTLYGGLLGGIIAGWLIIKKYKLNFWSTADLFALVLPLGIFIARLGCSLVNDHQGAITSLPWAIQWPDETLRHPVAEYLALNALIMFSVFWFWRKQLKKPGQLFVVFLFWYGISRFFLDFTRASDTFLADPSYLGLFISQWISIFIVIFSGVLILRFSFKSRIAGKN